MRIKLLIPILIPLAFTSCDFVGKQMMKERFKDFDIDAISSGMSLMKTAGKPLVFTLPELECGQEYAAPMSEFLDSIYIVPLETTPESLIGYPSKMMVCNDTLYVLDTMKGKSLKRFTMDGRYIDKIAGVGNGPGEFVEPTDFYVGSQIEILDQFQEKIIVFDKQGSFVCDRRIPFIALQFIRLDSLTYLFRSSDSQNYHIDGLLDYNLWTTDTSFNIKERGFYREKGEWVPLWNPDGMYSADGKCYLTDFFTDTIFSLSPGGALEAQIVMDFNGHSSPDTYKDKEHLRATNKSDKYYICFNYSICNDYVRLNVGLCGYGHDIYYSKRAGRCIIADNILLDGEGIQFHSIDCSASTAMGNTFMFLRDCYELLDNPDFGKYKDYVGGNFGSIKPDDNPVMVFFKMKDW